MKFSSFALFSVLLSQELEGAQANQNDKKNRVNTDKQKKKRKKKIAAQKIEPEIKPTKIPTKAPVPEPEPLMQPLSNHDDDYTYYPTLFPTFMPTTYIPTPYMPDWGYDHGKSGKGHYGSKSSKGSKGYYDDDHWMDDWNHYTYPPSTFPPTTFPPTPIQSYYPTSQNTFPTLFPTFMPTTYIPTYYPTPYYGHHPHPSGGKSGKGDMGWWGGNMGTITATDGTVNSDPSYKGQVQEMQIRGGKPDTKKHKGERDQINTMTTMTTHQEKHKRGGPQKTTHTAGIETRQGGHNGLMMKKQKKESATMGESFGAGGVVSAASNTEMQTRSEDPTKAGKRRRRR